MQEELAPVVAKNAPTQNGTQDVAKNATPYENQVVAKFATPYEHGSHKGQIQIHQVEYYSLDVILSVGYRVKSSRGIEFRRWANNVLREYVPRGHAINQRILAVEERVDNRLMSQEPIDTHVWKNPSHDRWLIIDDTVYHCGHSLKDMGQKLSAIAQLGVDAEDILKNIR